MILSFAQEIVVAESGSTDATVDLALERGARSPSAMAWLRGQRQSAVEQARKDRVSCIDVAKRVIEALRARIESALAAPRFGACRYCRCNRFPGMWLRHGEGDPEWSLRLSHRRCARWLLDSINEKVVADCLFGRRPAARVAGIVPNLP